MPRFSIKDITLYYEIHGVGAPILLIHGLGSSILDWESQVSFFSKSYQVIAVDIRGHGQTDKPEGPYSIQLFAEDICALIRFLDLPPVHLVGHSLGGMIAFQLVLDNPEWVKSLTIINSAPALIFPNLSMRIRFLLRHINIKLFGMNLLSYAIAKKLFPKKEQAIQRKLIFQRWRKNDPKAYLSTLQAFNGWNVALRLNEIKCPTLIVTADDDYTPVSMKEWYTALIANAELVVIPNSGHMTIIDQAAALNEVMLRFFKRI